MPNTVQTRLDPPQVHRGIRRIAVSDRAKDHPQVEPLLDRARRLGMEVIEQINDDFSTINQKFRSEKRTLRLDINRGSFIKPWASDPNQVGEDEWCLTPVEGCPLDCSYCYLQDYLDRPLVTAYINQEIIAEQIECFLEDPPEAPPHYFSLGELSDGIFLEPLLDQIPRIWRCFSGREDAHLEIRSKSHHVHGLTQELDPHSSGVFTWSLSPEDMAKRDEMLTSSLAQRLQALAHMSSAGFQTAVRIDPILIRDNWEQSYRELITDLFDVVDPEDLSYLILGTFRFPRGFDRTMEKRFPNRSFLREEFVEGPDGTFRYARSTRTEVFRTLRRWLNDYGVEPDLCMEPSYVWEDAGFTINPGQHA